MLSELPEAIPLMGSRVGIQPHPAGPRARASYSALHCLLPAPSSGHLCMMPRQGGRASLGSTSAGNMCIRQLKFFVALRMATQRTKKVLGVFGAYK